jgi:hypothetical protein
LDRPYKPAQSAEQISGARSKEGAGAFSKQFAVETSVETSVTVDDLNGQLCEISISHDGMFATAVALVPSVGGLSTKVDSIETLRP